MIYLEEEEEEDPTLLLLFLNPSPYNRLLERNHNP